MLAQISGAQAALEGQLEALRHAANLGGDTASLAIAQNQLSRLGGLSHRIEHASGVNLTAIRAEVTASIGAAQAVAQQARTVAASGTAAEVALHTAQAEAHRVTGDFLHDFYERKIFDPYLRFGSPEEERAYREREAAREKAIEEARARGTPEGELQALRLSREQLEDAGRHGAKDSPDYAPMLSTVSNAEEALARTSNEQSVEARAALQSHNQPTAELVSPDIIASLRAAGVVPTGIDASANSLPKTLTSEPARGLG